MPTRDRRSYHHRGGARPLLGETIDTFVRAVMATHPEREAVVSLAQGERLTYAELDREVQAVARGLLALGIGAGSRVGVWSTDNVEWLLLQLATTRIGAILVNVNPAYRVAELEHALRHARVEALFLIPSFRSSDYVAMTRTLCPEVMETDALKLTCAGLPELRRLVIWDPSDRAATVAPAPGFVTWTAMCSAGDAIADADVEARARRLETDDPINIQFTSGTTGFPKAVVLTHHNILNNGYWVGEAMRLTERDRLCVPVPFYHCFGMVVANLACLTHGAAIVIPSPHFEAGATLAAIEAERCTAVHGVPTMFVAELEHLHEHAHDLGSLRTGIMAGAPCPPELVHRVMTDLHCPEILIGYGQTEASPVSHATMPDDPFERRVGTVGTNLPHQEARIVDPDTGRTVAIGQQGELCFRGYHVMRGYFDDPEATHQAIDEAGWLHSGDLGVMDDDGYLRITGRLKDMIIRGGENVYPAEIEAFLYTHPKVAEIAVFGLPDERLGEQIAAWVKPREGESLTPDELREWAHDRIAHFKIPRWVWIVDEFPMTVTGKIQKFRMREIAIGWRDSAGAPSG